MEHQDNMQPLVSIITVNYNQANVTLALIDSLRKISYACVELIVVDNGSEEDCSFIKLDFPEVQLIRSEENLGFAGGNNLGIVAASGDYLLFLNNDTEVPEGFLEPLVNMFTLHVDAGLVSPRLLYYYSDNIIQYAGARKISPYTGRGSKIGIGEKDSGQYNQSRESDLGHGAAMMVPRSVIEETGLMPDIYFLYYEEHDWCEAIKRKGYKVYYCGESTVLHKESISVGKMSALKSYYMARNRLLFMRRNTGGMVRILSMMYYLFLAAPKALIHYLLKGEKRLFQAYAKGLFWHIKRGRIQGYPTISYTPQGEAIIENESGERIINGI